MSTAVGRTAFPHAPPLAAGSPWSREYEDETFTGRVIIDNGRFRRCTFRGAVLIYAGGPPPLLADCVFDGAIFEFQGPARNTTQMLQAMSASGSGLREVFKASFPRIFGH